MGFSDRTDKQTPPTKDEEIYELKVFFVFIKIVSIISNVFIINKHGVDTLRTRPGNKHSFFNPRPQKHPFSFRAIYRRHIRSKNTNTEKIHKHRSHQGGETEGTFSTRNWETVEKREQMYQRITENVLVFPTRKQNNKIHGGAYDKNSSPNLKGFFIIRS